MRPTRPVLLLLLVGAAALAEEPSTQRTRQVVQEVFLGELAQTQEAGAVQLWSGVHVRPGDDEARVRTPMLLEVGITHHLQLEANAELGLATGQGTEVGGLEVGALYSLVDSRPLGLVGSAGVDVELPFGALRESDALTLVPRAILYKRLAPLVLNLAVGAAVPVSGEEGPGLRGALSALWGQPGLLHPVLEVEGESGDSPRARLSAGTLLHVNESWEFGLAYVLARDSQATTSGVFATALFELEPE